MGEDMEFRPCIDIHNGKVKQLVGSSVQDQGDLASENYVSAEDAAWFAKCFADRNLKNGHVILLNKKDSPYYEQTRQQALRALQAYPGGLQIGGGITADNAQDYLDAGASHVIVTSYVFQNGTISFENLYRLVEKVGRNKLVLDLSCRKKDGQYYIVTDRWQKYTHVVLSGDILTMLASFCDEFLIHGVDVEGTKNGIEEPLIDLLGRWHQIPITYAGGIRSFSDIDKIRTAGNNRIHVTVGSALDLYGGNLPFEETVRYVQGA